MARDAGLEERVNAALAEMAGVTQKSMFGGRAWLVNGNLLCAARTDRLWSGSARGTTRRPWRPRASRTVMRGRSMVGSVWAGREVFGDDRLQGKLLVAAVAFNRMLPGK